MSAVIIDGKATSKKLRGEVYDKVKKLGDMGDKMAYEQVMLAVSDFEKGNLRLSTILAAMQ